MIEGNEEKKAVVEDGQVVFTPDTKADKADNAKKVEKKKDLSEIFTDLDSFFLFPECLFDTHYFPSSPSKIRTCFSIRSMLEFASFKRATAFS